jgi:osmoprotectant transport system permease protein
MVLNDPKQAIPRYDAILIASPKHAGDARFLTALKPLIGAIPVERMREANYMVDRDADKATPEQAAAWLEKGINALILPGTGRGTARSAVEGDLHAR